MIVRVIEQAAWRAQSWNNGGGITHEIWRTPDRDDYDLRVSVAEVTSSGAFSQFPGYRRWSFLVGTAPIELVHEQTIELVAPGDHVELPGEAAITATLRAGPTHLLNILARTPIVAGHGPVAHAVRFVFALAPRPRLARWASAVLEPPASIETTDCIWIA